MNNLRLILALPFLVGVMIALGVLYLFGVPFLIIGGKRAIPIFDGVTKMIKD